MHFIEIRRCLLFVLLAGSTVWTAAAQPNMATVITGRVTDADTGMPLSGAHVFVAASMNGTTTDLDGQYRLQGVPTGALRLYVSMLGYEPEARDLLLRRSQVYTFDFQLSEKVLDVGEVVVEAEGDPNWKERLERFITLFIGETPNASEVEITNPEVLDFAIDGGALVAYASEPLIIENKALGYRIQYFLNDFRAEPRRTQYDGEPLYEEMEPESPEQANEWDSARRKAFLGSFRHFLLALLASRTEGQGFKTYTRPGMSRSPADGFSAASTMSDARFPLDPAKILKPGESEGERTLEFEGYIEIVFMGEEEDPKYLDWSGSYGRQSTRFQTSWITMERGPTTVDYKGDVLDPYGVTFSGYLAFERVAEEVPKEYRPR